MNDGMNKRLPLTQKRKRWDDTPKNRTERNHFSASNNLIYGGNYNEKIICTFNRFDDGIQPCGL